MWRGVPVVCPLEGQGLGEPGRHLTACPGPGSGVPSGEVDAGQQEELPGGPHKRPGRDGGCARGRPLVLRPRPLMPIGPQVVDYYKEACRALESPDTACLLGRIQKDWKKLVQMKIYYFAAVAHVRAGASGSGWAGCHSLGLSGDVSLLPAAHGEAGGGAAEVRGAGESVVRTAHRTGSSLLARLREVPSLQKGEGS